MEKLDSFIALFNIIVVAIPTSFLSAYLTIKNYRSEKWWDKKAGCYVDTVAAMNDIIRFCDNFLAQELDGRETRFELEQELKKKFHEARLFIVTSAIQHPITINHSTCSKDSITC